MCIIVVKVTNITAIKFNRTSQISQYVGRAIMDITFIKDIMDAKDITVPFVTAGAGPGR